MPWKDKKDEEAFHEIHKVPAGDSPYVRAKRAQLIEQDPSKAIALFWAAINAGDRVDSALKDMAVVMKQLDRSDEAVEAIKSFRHLCPDYSQESLDNVLLELYKRTKSIEDEIKLLKCKLKRTEEVIASGGRSTKTARCQGRKTQITIVQELSRKALSLESDKNKQCNLAICLIRLNRIAEATSLLQAVRESSGNGQIDESYAKSFERASLMLTGSESQSMLQQDKSYKYINRSQEEYVSRSMVSRRWRKFSYPETPWKNSNGSILASTGIVASSVQKKPYASPVGVISYSLSPVTQPRPSWRFHNMEHSIRRSREDATDNPHRKVPIKQMTAGEKMEEDAVMFTQPRSSWGSRNREQRRERWREAAIGAITSKNMEAHAVQNLNGKLQASTYKKSEMGQPDSAAALSSPTSEDWRRRPWKIIAKVKQKKQYSGIHCHSAVESERESAV